MSTHTPPPNPMATAYSLDCGPTPSPSLAQVTHDTSQQMERKTPAMALLKFKQHESQ